MRDGKWKLHLPRKQRGEVGLCDLSVVPSEGINIADEHPDVVARLRKTI
jgi:N-acetylgalactosamine-6-sulfatase